jgi:DNA-binding response OmpR family regulator
MDHRNRANGNVPVMCSYEELIEAVWDEHSDRTETDLNHLVWGLRKKIGDNSQEPQFLETVSGLGYRLKTQPLQV